MANIKFAIYTAQNLPMASGALADGQCAKSRRQNSFLINGKFEICQRHFRAWGVFEQRRDAARLEQQPLAVCFM